MYLGQEDCPPSTFGLMANDATKLLSKSFLFLAAILSTEERVALRLQRNYLLNKSLKTVRFCGKWSNFFDDRGTVYKCNQKPRDVKI